MRVAAMAGLVRLDTFLDTTLQYCGQSGCVDGPVWGGEAQTTHRYRDASGATYFFDFAYALCGSGCRPPGLSATLTDSSTFAYDNGTILRFELPPSAKDNTVPGASSPSKTAMGIRSALIGMLRDGRIKFAIR